VRLQPGEIVDGRYRLVERIGSGGMADVWRATDPELDRDVAIKVLHENFARDSEFVERFRREASSAAGLQHPNVVSIYDRGTYEGSYYIAMELIEGSSLRDLITRGLEPGEAIEVTRQVLAAASFAHGRGIVHRDLKPMNVLIDREGRVKVADFGIARAGNSEITQTGSVMGTAQYLSPEQAQGVDVGPGTDIYSIGVMLFEMLTGRVPFEGDNAVAIAMKQVAEEPLPPSTLNPAVSPALDAVVLRALAKDPVERFASAAEMAAALDAAEADPERSPGHTERFVVLAAEEAEEEREERRWWIAAAVIALLLAGVLAYLLTRPELVTVPQVDGRSEAQAINELRDAGLEWEVERMEHPTPEGEVIESDPRGGTEAEEGSTVVLTVSLGPGTVAIPRVAGLPAEKATAKLERAGFEVDVRRRPSDAVPAGRAIGTEPANVELEPGSLVDLLVSSGPRTASVPDVVGMDRSSATAALRDAGFLVDADAENSDEPEDEVLSQDPAADTSATIGTEVTITYSNGIGTIRLDNLTGQKLEFAERKLANAGLDLTVVEQEVSDASDDGIVLEQAPPAGTRLSPGDRVTLTVGTFVEPEPEPDPEPPPTTTTDTTTEGTTP